MTNSRARANTPSLSRRNFVGATMTLPFTSQAAAHPISDPVLVEFEKWQKARADWITISEIPDICDDDPDWMDAERRELAAWHKMGTLTPTTLEGCAATLSSCSDTMAQCRVIPTNTRRKHHGQRTGHWRRYGVLHSQVERSTQAWSACKHQNYGNSTHKW